MSAAVMALAETSRSYRKQIEELEAKVARLQATNDELNHSFSIYDLGADKDAKRIAELQRDLAEVRTECEGLKSDNGRLDWEVKKLRLDCSEARGYGLALYDSLRALYEGLGDDKLPKPPWLDG